MFQGKAEHAAKTTQLRVFRTQSPRPSCSLEVEEKYQEAGSQAEYRQENVSHSSIGVVPLCSASDSPGAVVSSYLTDYLSEISTTSVEEAVTALGGITAVIHQESRPFLHPGQLIGVSWGP